MVAARARVFPSDEELGKRNDDFKPRKMGTWNIKHRPAWRKRRIFGLAAACFAIWLFIHYIPTDLGPVDRQTGLHVRYPTSRSRALTYSEKKQSLHGQQSADSDGAVGASGSDSGSDQDAEDYDGPIRFLNLASTLTAGSRETSDDAISENVVFAASDLNSAGAIIPIACEMARWNTNHVHMAVMGKNDLSLEDIQRINGAAKESCKVLWHDARPDNAKTSSERRMEVGVAGALGHIHSFLRPTVVITADLENEDRFFAWGAQRKAKEKDLTHIQVPKDDPESLSWLARLDSMALKAWHAARIDILVQAPLESSGSLVRLLKSLEDADYTGFTPPRLTLEIPHEMDASTMKYLRSFKWPPRKYESPDQGELLTVHRRIFEQRQSPEEASLRFVESFYPTSPSGTNVLVLSPQAELSPVFFQYLKLYLLQYKHSTNARLSNDLFGISLEAPSVHLNGKQRFIPPKSTPASEGRPDDEETPEPFRWQASNSNAALYFADKWIEAHSFLMKRYSATRHPRTKNHFGYEERLISDQSPAWAEYFLQLMRMRGYFLQYPRLPSLSSKSKTPSASLAIVHNELYQLPEEFAKTEEKDTSVTRPPPPTDSILVVKDDYLSSHKSSMPHNHLINTEIPLLDTLVPFLKDAPAAQQNHEDSFKNIFTLHPTPRLPPVPYLSSLPLLDHAGNLISEKELANKAKELSAKYRRTAGGCSAEQAEYKKSTSPSVDDLFCLDEKEDGTYHRPPPARKVAGKKNGPEAESSDERDPNNTDDEEEEEVSINKVVGPAFPTLDVNKLARKPPGDDKKAGTE